MTVGFAMLVHESLDRAAAVARHLAGQGAPLAIHIDARVPQAEAAALRDSLAEFGRVRFVGRRRCDWGTWSIVAATRETTRTLLDSFPEVGHVYLISGACLPLRPLAELAGVLERNPDTDFIESVTIGDVGWTVGGLSRERFDLSFPFAWKRQRALFDVWVRVQRRLGLTRPAPKGLDPHIGSQWWCLTRETLDRIDRHPEAPVWERYFRRVWIPDESYYQTVVRQVARRLESRSLTLSKFDFQGKPHILYDDHLDLLQHSDRFFARKVWPRAEGLYRAFLPATGAAPMKAVPDPGRIDRHFAHALAGRTQGRPGLYNQARFPNGGWENGKTAAPYAMFQGFAELFEDFAPWLQHVSGIRMHGHLFAPGRAEFTDGQAEFAGALSDSAALRDYNPVAFLTSLVWNTRGERQGFSFGPADNQEINGFVASDPNATVSLITGAWLVPMLKGGTPVPAIRARAAALQAAEAAQLAHFRAAYTRARVRIWTLAEAIEAPRTAIETVLADLGAERAGPAPELTDVSDLRRGLEALRDIGMWPHIAGVLGPDAEDAVAPGRGAVARTG